MPDKDIGQARVTISSRENLDVQIDNLFLIGFNLKRLDDAEYIDRLKSQLRIIAAINTSLAYSLVSAIQQGNENAIRDCEPAQAILEGKSGPVAGSIEQRTFVITN